MNYTKLFYWLTVADNAKAFFIVFIIIFTIVSFISVIAYFINGGEKDYDSQKMSRKWVWYSVPFMILFWSLYIFTPDKKDALLIVAGGQTMNFLTTDSTAKQVPHEVLNFVVAELRSMASEAKVDIDVNTQKSRILDEAKQMTATELMEKMKVDTTFTKLILNK